MILDSIHPIDAFRYCPKCGSLKFEIEDTRSKKCKACGFHYYANVSAAVALFIYDGNGRLLLCERGIDPAKGMWDLPGGFVEFDESAEDAVRREVKEELNINVGEIKFLFSIPNIYRFSDFNVHTLDLFYETTLENFDNLKCDDDVSTARFVKMEDIDIERIGLTSIKKAVETVLKKHNF